VSPIPSVNLSERHRPVWWDPRPARKLNQSRPTDFDRKRGGASGRLLRYVRFSLKVLPIKLPVQECRPPASCSCGLADGSATASSLGSRRPPDGCTRCQDAIGRSGEETASVGW